MIAAMRRFRPLWALLPLLCAAPSAAETVLERDFSPAPGRLEARPVGKAAFLVEIGDRFGMGDLSLNDDALSAARAQNLTPFEGKEGAAGLNSAFLRLSTEGRLSESFSFEASIRIHNDLSSDDLDTSNYQAYQGLPFNVQEDNRRTWDVFTGVARWRGSFFRLQAGVDYLSAGPAERNPLVLGGRELPWRPWQHGSSAIAERAPMLHGAFSMFMGPFVYTQILGSPRHTTGYEKYLHYHRLQAGSERWSFAVGEAVVYGSTPTTAGQEYPDSSDRSMEWGYALPFVPYYFAEHYLGDRDNAMLFADFTVRPIRHRAFDGLEFYGEFAIDDLKSPGDLFKNWWGNKWAVTAGVRHRLRGGRIPWGWGYEFTQIEPWVYTHAKGAAYDDSHYGFPLGSDLGPNAREHWIHVDVEPAPVGRLSLGFSTVWKGFDRGSSVSDLHSYLIDGNGKSTLSPSARGHWNEVSLGWSRLFPLGVTAELEGGWLFGDAEGFRIRGEAKVPLRISH